jgi:hypothetical protein
MTNRSFFYIFLKTVKPNLKPGFQFYKNRFLKVHSLLPTLKNHQKSNISIRVINFKLLKKEDRSKIGCVCVCFCHPSTILLTQLSFLNYFQPYLPIYSQFPLALFLCLSLFQLKLSTLA